MVLYFSFVSLIADTLRNIIKENSETNFGYPPRIETKINKVTRFTWKLLWM